MGVGVCMLVGGIKKVACICRIYVDGGWISFVYGSRFRIRWCSVTGKTIPYSRHIRTAGADDLIIATGGLYRNCPVEDCGAKVWVTADG